MDGTIFDNTFKIRQMPLSCNSIFSPILYDITALKSCEDYFVPYPAPDPSLDPVPENFTTYYYDNFDKCPIDRCYKKSNITTTLVSYCINSISVPTACSFISEQDCP